jgi:hypothetical protein
LAPSEGRLGCFLVFVGQSSAAVEAAILRADAAILPTLEAHDHPMWIDPCRRMRRHIYREMDDSAQLGRYIEEVARTREVRFATVGLVLTFDIQSVDQ